MKTAPLVLVATADDRTRQLAALMLSEAGLRAEAASSGQQALLKADGLVPSVVVADLNMPDMDGVTLRDRLRAQPRTRMIPMLIVTGSQKTWLDAIATAGRVVRLQAAGNAPPLTPPARFVSN